MYFRLSRIVLHCSVCFQLLNSPDMHGFVAGYSVLRRPAQSAWKASIVVPIMRPAPVHIGPNIGTFSIRRSLSHNSTALPRQPVTDTALPS
jgi:hypothetical protein